MDPLFQQTLRSLERDDNIASRLVGGIAALGLLGLLAWGTLVQVPVQTQSIRAEVRVLGGEHRVDVATAGQIAHLPSVGQAVSAGDELGQLEDPVLSASLLGATQEHRALEVAVSAMREQVAKVDAALSLLENQSALDAAITAALSEAATAQARLAEARAAAAQNALTAISALEHQTAQQDAARRVAEARAAARSAQRTRVGTALTQLERQGLLEGLRADLAESERDLAAAATRRAVLEEAQRTHHLRAPVSGVVSWVTDRLPGTRVSAGEPLFTILTDGPTGVVAWFDGPRTRGPLQPGQRAQLRVDAYPWTTHGMVPAVVTSVARATPDGEVRVELDIPATPAPSVPLQHGASGIILVEVGRTAPIALALRAFGGPG